MIFPLKKVLSAVETVIQNRTGVRERGKAGSGYDGKARTLNVSVVLTFYCTSSVPLLCGEQLEFIVATGCGYRQLLLH